METHGTPAAHDTQQKPTVEHTIETPTKPAGDHAGETHAKPAADDTAEKKAQHTGDAHAEPQAKAHEIVGEATAEIAGDAVEKDGKFELHISEKRAQQIKRGEKDFVADRALTFDIDEVLPVGQEGIKPQRAVDRARSAYNRQLLDPNTNQLNQGLGIHPRELRGTRRPASSGVRRDRSPRIDYETLQ